MNEILMFPIEIIIFCLLAFGIFRMKKYYPNALFPPSGVTVILPPENEDMKQEKGTKSLVQIRTLKAEAEHFIQAPYANELEITMLFIYMLFAQYVLIELVKIIGELLDYQLNESGMLFYFDLIIIVMIVRNIFKAATIGGYDQQQTRMSIVVCIISTLLMIMVNLGFKDFINIHIRHEFQKQAYHFEIVLRTVLKPGTWSIMSQFGEIFIVILSLVVSSIIFCVLPILIRFGNCFSETKNEMTKQGENKKLFGLFIAQLFTQLIFVLLYLKPFTKDLGDHVFYLQFAVMLIYTLLTITTYTKEMDKHMAKGYDWAVMLKDQPEYQDQIVRKMQGILRGMVIVSYQLLSKIALPILLMMILLMRNNKIEINYQAEEMYCIQEQVNIIQYMYDTQETKQETLLEDSKILMKRISNYGLLNKSFIYSFIEFVLFNYHFVTFVLSVFYLFFLNKTQAVSKGKQINKKIKKQ